MKTLIKNADIYLESSIIKSGSLIINGSKIESIIKEKTEINEKEYKVIDAKGFVVAPGYMDSHCHG